MHKFNWVLSTLLVSATIVSGLPTQSMQSAVAQINPPQSWATIFGNFFNQQTPPKDNGPTAGSGGPATGRGGVCALTPRTSGSNTEVWSDRPLFVWRGLPLIKKIEVRLPGSKQALWDEEFSGRTFRVMYGGEKPLQSGQTYNWVVLDQTNKEHSFEFKVLDAQQRDRIKADLTKLEEELKGKGATPEEIAVQRAEYFAQKQLWSDVLQEIYSVQNPSPGLNKKVKATAGEICYNLVVQNSAQAR